MDAVPVVHHRVKAHSCSLGPSAVALGVMPIEDALAPTCDSQYLSDLSGIYRYQDGADVGKGLRLLCQRRARDVPRDHKAGSR
jgi:hypothetical protein